MNEHGDIDLAGAMVCDIETGVCGPADAGAAGQTLQTVTAAGKVDVYYVTDPICSHCWALEPVLKRFEHEYARHVDVRVVMGGLLPAWRGFADKANGIGGPADVAGHWRQVGRATRMPIDGSVWLRDPLASSYPPSRVYVVLREQDPELARAFLRRAREAVFAFDRNVADPAVLAAIVDGLGRDGSAVVAEAEGERGRALLDADLAFARELGVRGFPTLVFVAADGRSVAVVGARGVDAYVSALRSLLGEDALELPLERLPLRELLAREGRLFARELEVYYDVAPGRLDGFVASQLEAGSYRSASVLGETMLALPDLASAPA